MFDRSIARAHPAAPVDDSGLGAGAPSASGLFDPPRSERLPRLIGFDEAGRGALAGPVAVGCVQLPDRWDDPRDPAYAAWFGIDDSKRLTAPERAAAYERITSRALWAVGYASADEIDRVGIVAACDAATRRAYLGLASAAEAAVLDRGLSLRRALSPLGRVDAPPEVLITRGDATSLHIAAASIVAKVHRDALMVHLDRVAPGYGLAKHKGYGTTLHRQALLSRGPSPIHRQSFLRKGEWTKSQFC